MDQQLNHIPLEDHSFMNDLFPFYILLDENLHVRNLGDSMAKFNAVKKGDQFLSRFTIVSPLNTFSREDIRKQSQSLFIFYCNANPNVKFRGQMYVYGSSELTCFIGGPLINSVSELNDYNLTLNDFAIFDNISQFLFTLQMQMSALNDSKVISDKLREYKTQLEKALEETEKAKLNQQSFFAKMSHELRTPLNGIIGMTKLIQSTPLNNDQQEYMKTILISSKSLLKIINDILDLSKLKSDQFTLEAIKFSMNELIEEVYQSFKFNAESKGLALNYHVSNLIRDCIGDPLRISQVLVNLVSNAVKFTNKGKIDINVNFISEDATSQIMEISVVDTGKGIGIEKLYRIFNVYEQEDRSITREFGGTGLGLTISNEIIQKYESKIDVESVEGKGSKFSFQIKLPKAVETVYSEEIVKTIYSFDHLKVLLVEDNEINKFYAETILKQKNMLVETAENGEIAVEMVKSNNYDLILMDMQMPIMNGITATEIIRKDLQIKTPIIGLSANTVSEDIKSCFEAGMDDYLSKPFEPDELYVRIGEILHLNQENQPNLDSNFYSLDRLRNMNQNPSATVKILELFLKNVPKDIEDSKKAFQNSDFEQIITLIHKNKPTYEMLNAYQAVQICEQIDNCCRNNQDLSLLGKCLNQLYGITQILADAFNKEIDSEN